MVEAGWGGEGRFPPAKCNGSDGSDAFPHACAATDKTCLPFPRPTPTCKGEYETPTCLHCSFGEGLASLASNGCDGMSRAVFALYRRSCGASAAAICKNCKGCNGCAGAVEVTVSDGLVWAIRPRFKFKLKKVPPAFILNPSPPLTHEAGS